ncbi:unnamed protein product [Rotaria socialis]|uniref:Transposase n=1 Tax=Rotaria socialis TaxID=392032 RepID=A0A818HD69_9BILA|nr:unnamed protein product [Rotaria socialis]
MILEQDSSRPQGFMVWACILSYGRSSFVFKQKEKRTIFLQDSAPSHVSKKTIAFLNASKMKYVKPEEYMPKSPHAATMDYSIWGYLKQRLNKQKIGSLSELKKIHISGQSWIKFILIKF